MPHHWDDRKDRAPERSARGRPDFEAQAWAVGQVATAKAALDLLARRAHLAEKEAAKQPWPEFAEHDCFACHHDLKAPSWRQEHGYSERVPGTLPWADWYFAMTPRAVAVLGNDGDQKITDALRALKKQMARPYPDPQAVAAAAAAAAQRVNHDLKRWEQGSTVMLHAPELFRMILKEDRAQAQATWDTAAQYYLALAAMHSAWSDLTPLQGAPSGELRKTLAALREALRFRRNHDSPRELSPAVLRARLSALDPFARD
jgi:hypothetical protein